MELRKTTVKLCGIKRAEDVRLCIQAGVDVLGFVTEYPLEVPWNLTREGASDLLRTAGELLQGADIAGTPSFSERSARVWDVKTCLVTGGSVRKVVSLAASLRPSLIQLHYRETWPDTREIVRELRPMGIQVIKTLPTDSGERVEQFGTACVEDVVKKLCELELYGILVDARTPKNAGEGGIRADVDFFRLVSEKSAVPVILAGGINPDNIRTVLAQSQARFVDVMTGVEDSPGVKNPDAVARLLAAVRGGG